jgi:hypothetical protein
LCFLNFEGGKKNREEETINFQVNLGFLGGFVVMIGRDFVLVNQVEVRC